MQDPLPPNARVDGVSADLERVVLKCIAKQPAYRYQTVRELDAALAECVDAGSWDNDAARAFWTGLRPSIRLRSRAEEERE
jgi:serine/threonine-protein kinase